MTIKKLNLEQLKDRVLAAVNEYGTSRFIKVDDDIPEFINLTQRELADILRLEGEPCRWATRAGHESYELPRDFNKAKDLSLHDVSYVFKDFKDFRVLRTPRTYSRWERRLYICPVPTVADADIADDDAGENENVDNDGSLVLYYYKRPATLSDPRDVPEIDAKYQELLILNAVAEYYKKDESFSDVYLYLKRDYEAAKTRLVENRYTQEEDIDSIRVPWGWG